MIKVHYLKSLTHDFENLKSGIRQFDIRGKENNFKIGDTLIIDELNQVTMRHTGRWIPKTITYIQDDEGFVKEGFVILALRDIRF